MGDRTKATGKATAEESAQPPTTKATGRLCREDRTLLSWYEEAMKEKPRPIEDALTTTRGQETTMSEKGDAGDNQGDRGGHKRETWLEARNKSKKTTEQAILRRNKQLAEFRQTSYKEALEKAIKEQARATIKIVKIGRAHV